MEQPEYSAVLELDLASVETSLAGPKRPQDRVPLSRAKASWREVSVSPGANGNGVEVDVGGERETLRHGAVVFAAITFSRYDTRWRTAVSGRGNCTALSSSAVAAACKTC